jgi:hypothetical protein
MGFGSKAILTFHQENRLYDFKIKNAFERVLPLFRTFGVVLKFEWLIMTRCESGSESVAHGIERTVGGKEFSLVLVVLCSIKLLPPESFCPFCMAAAVVSCTATILYYSDSLLCCSSGSPPATPNCWRKKAMKSCNILSPLA